MDTEVSTEKGQSRKAEKGRGKLEKWKNARAKRLRQLNRSKSDTRSTSMNEDTLTLLQLSDEEKSLIRGELSRGKERC
jgi:hypothetical protein